MVNLPTSDRDKVDKAYDYIAFSIAAYEGSPEVNAFTSKFDAYIAGMASLTKQEQDGLKLLKAKPSALPVMF